MTVGPRPARQSQRSGLALWFSRVKRRALDKGRRFGGGSPNAGARAAESISR